MKLHEAWRHRYRLNRDLDHLSDVELSERLHDAMNNVRTRTAKGQVGLQSMATGRGEALMVLFTEVLEECQIRGCGYPGPLNISSYRAALDHAFDPIPDMDRLFDHYDLANGGYLLKFGELRWMTEAMTRGAFRVASASYYAQDAHNHARRDSEMTRYLRINPRAPDYVPSATGWQTVSAASDYYLFSLTQTYSARLFGDFAANSCLVIFHPEKFLFRLTRAVAKQLPGWKVEVSVVKYFDPVRTRVADIVVPTSKPFRHAYQEEVRLIAIPPTPRADLGPVAIELGPLDDCATLADLSAYPPAKRPHDPKDDPVQIFGRVSGGADMLNHLPSAAKVQGIRLDKSAPRHESWTIHVQYTDADGGWHELSMPMLDGLHLLNLLKAAESEQSLGLWNRPGELQPRV